jgi:hypothetical protein
MKFNERAEMLVQRFFEIIEEEGAEWNEIFLIRDLLMEEYIAERYSQVCIIQIDDIVEEALERFEDMNDIMLDCEVEALEKMIWQALSDKEVEHVIDLLNMYGDKQHAHPYVYYCMVRELERITGENLIELVLPVSGI